jgi:hypothetical protein
VLIRIDRPAVKKKVRVAIACFWAGATVTEIVGALLPDLQPYFDFEPSATPDVVLYGPYAGDMPEGRYTKVFIGCENVRPLMNECDWAFGVLHEEYMRHPRYMRFMRWGDDSPLMQKDKNWAEVLRSKTRFCAFVFDNEVYYSESFYRALSRYKHVDAPGRSMNNMPTIHSVPGKVDWREKIEFLRGCKFVIAFENSSAPGYNTEKLTHAIEADCLPIYWGDPQVGRSYNTRRFINAHDFLAKPIRFMPRLPYSPHSVKATARPAFLARVSRKLNSLSSAIEQYTWAAKGFGALVDHVATVDRDDGLYLRYLREPFFIGNTPPDRSAWIARWQKIFAQI